MTQPVASKISAASWLFSLALVLFIFALLSGAVSFWSLNGIPIFLSGKYTAFCGIGFLIVSVLLLGTRVSELRLNPETFCLGLSFLFLSDWLCKPYSLMQGPSIRGEIILGALFTLLLVRIRRLDLFWLALPISVLVLALAFLYESRGRLLFSDDNATFFYRLELLKNFFPSIPFFNPFWNGGYDARDFFATGSLNLFLLFYPIIKFASLESSYNLIIALLLFVLSPLVIYLSARLENLPPKSSALASLLSLCTSILWYRWSLKYGTLGFTTTTILIPLNLALAIRIIAPDCVIRWYHAAVFVISFSLMLFWSLSAFVFVPIFLLACLRPLAVLRKRFCKSIVVALVLLNLPWIYIFCSVSNVGSFLHAEKTPQLSTSSEPKKESSASENWRFKQRAGSINLKKSLKSLKEFGSATNPLLIFLILPGIFLLPKRSRLAAALTYGWLLLLGSLIPPLKPQLELDRMLVILSHCASIPCAFVIHYIFSKSTEREHPLSWLLISPALIGGFLFAGPLSVAGLLRNHTLEQISFASDNVGAMVEAIKRFGGEGRTLFSGCVVHELSQGHLAPLALWSGHPLIASSPVHNLWNYRQIFPREFLLRGDSGIDDYLNLYNVSSVIAHEPEWRNYFLKRPDQFKEVWNGESFKMFQRINYQSNYFLEGSGQILSQESNLIRVKPFSNSVTLKFNYFPFLKSSACELSAYAVAEGINLIKLSDCPENQEVTIQSVGPLTRTLGVKE